MLGGAAVRRQPAGASTAGMRVLERIDESVHVVEELLAGPVPVPSV